MHNTLLIETITAMKNRTISNSAQTKPWLLLAVT